MGIDWFRMRPKPNVAEGELRRLIDLQAQAFHGLPGLWATDGIEPQEDGDQQATRILEQQYRESSQALRQLLEFPAVDRSSADALDLPGLRVVWRVYPITHNSLFPLAWRMRAHQTYLPESLPGQLRIWKDWALAVAQGQHRSYVLKLYLHHLTMRIHCLYKDIRNLVETSLTCTGPWASKPSLNAARKEILSFSVPEIFPAPLFQADQEDGSTRLAAEEAFWAIPQKVRGLIELTRAWDRNVKQNRKIRYYEEHYLTWEQFLAQAANPGLHEFFAWAEACCNQGMGLFLDY